MASLKTDRETGQTALGREGEREGEGEVGESKRGGGERGRRGVLELGALCFTNTCNLLPSKETRDA